MTSFRVHHVQLAIPAGQVESARAFYCGVLGLKELPKPSSLASRGGAWFGAGALELHLGVEEPFSPARKAHPGIEVSDLDALAERLESSGCAVRFDDDFPGRRRFYTADPFGNRLEFLSPEHN